MSETPQDRIDPIDPVHEHRSSRGRVVRVSCNTCMPRKKKCGELHYWLKYTLIGSLFLFVVGCALGLWAIWTPDQSLADRLNDTSTLPMLLGVCGSVILGALFGMHRTDDDCVFHRRDHHHD